MRKDQIITGQCDRKSNAYNYLPLLTHNWRWKWTENGNPADGVYCEFSRRRFCVLRPANKGSGGRVPWEGWRGRAQTIDTVLHMTRTMGGLLRGDFQISSRSEDGVIVSLSAHRRTPGPGCSAVPGPGRVTGQKPINHLLASWSARWLQDRGVRLGSFPGNVFYALEQFVMWRPEDSWHKCPLLCRSTLRPVQRRFVFRVL